MCLFSQSRDSHADLANHAGKVLLCQIRTRGFRVQMMDAVGHRVFKAWAFVK